jgi:hypothetical protein
MIVAFRGGPPQGLPPQGFAPQGPPSQVFPPQGFPAPGEPPPGFNLGMNVPGLNDQPMPSNRQYLQPGEMPRGVPSRYTDIEASIRSTRGSD